MLLACLLQIIEQSFLYELVMMMMIVNKRINAFVSEHPNTFLSSLFLEGSIGCVGLFVSRRIDALVAQGVLFFYLTRKRAATKLGHGRATHKFRTWFH